jgi:DNA-binding NarL/FixJ family response regulator
MDRLRILIADDHRLFRSGVRVLLEAMPDLEVVGEATSGDEAVALTETLEPDVVLMDLKMPGTGGVEATRRILEKRSGTRVLVVTMFEDDASVFTALRAGARGYVLKDAHKEEMLRAIRAVGSGEAIFSAGIAARVVEFFGNRAAIPRASLPLLTDREREILQLMVGGAGNSEIAQALGLSGKTVAKYVSVILSKLQVADRAAAVSRAREAGLG